MGNFFLDLLKVAAPVVGSLIAPGVGTAIGSMISGFIGNIQGQMAAGEAEKRMQEEAALARQLAMQALGDIRSGLPVKHLVQQATDVLGGRLAGAGLMGSSIAANAYSRVASDVLARVAPQQMQAMLSATRLAMTPSEWLFSNWSNAAQQAAGSSGFDLGFLVDLLPYLGSGFGGGGGTNMMTDWMRNRSAITPGGY